MQDHRSIPLEVLRDFVRTQAELTSIRAVAIEVGAGRTTLHSFLNEETTPHPRIRRLLAVWYLAKLDEAPDIDVIRPYAAALSILVSSLPEDERGVATVLLVESLGAIYAGREEQPRWMELLLKTGPVRDRNGLTLGSHPAISGIIRV